MSIHLITGLPRNGKSYYSVERIIEDLITSERNVYTNLPVHPDVLCRHVAVLKYNKKTERYLDIFENVMRRLHIFRTFTSFTELKSFRRKNPVFCRLHRERDRAYDNQDIRNGKLVYPFGYLADYWNHTRANSLFYLDECYQIWNYLDASERSKEAKERRKELQNYMRMHGHDGDDIFLITHKDRDLDTFILDTLSYRIEVRNSKYWPIIPQEIIDKFWWLSWLGTLRWPLQFFMLRTYIGDEKLPHRSFFKRCNRFIFRCYDSQSRPNGLRNRGYNSAVSSSDLGQSYLKELKSWFFDSFPALLILSILIFFAVGIFRGLQNMMRSSNRVTVSPVRRLPQQKNVDPLKKSQESLKTAVPKPVKLLSISPNTLYFDNGLIIRKGENYVLSGKDYTVVDLDRQYLYLVGADGSKVKYPVRLVR